MNNVICVVPVSPMRGDAAHRSEQVSQLLFGDVAEVLETSKDFTKVRSLFDGYEGWCQSNQLFAFDQDVDRLSYTYTTSWSTTLTCNGSPIQLPFGCNIGAIDLLDQTNSPYKFQGSTEAVVAPKQVDVRRLQEFAMMYINTSYQWGGKSVFGVDCSGFSQMVYKLCGINLLRDASQQATQGEAVGFLQEAQPGDLAFFDNDEGRITHVGIMLSTDTIIHASGKVKIDRIDQAGIISTESGQRTHKLRLIKRYF